MRANFESDYASVMSQRPSETVQKIRVNLQGCSVERKRREMDA